MRRPASARRALAAAWSTSIAALVVLAALLAAGGGPSPAAAAPARQDEPERLQLVVDARVDAPDAAPGDGVCAVAAPPGGCTLRAAIDEAVALAIPATIALPEGELVLDRLAEARYPDSALRVEGQGADVRLAGAGSAATTVRVAPGAGWPLRAFLLHVEPGARVAVQGLTLRGGAGTGGVHVFGHLDLERVVLAGCRDCVASVDVEEGGTARLTRSVIEDNVARYGIANWGGQLEVLTSTLQGNRVESQMLMAIPSIAGGRTVVRDTALVANRVEGGGDVSVIHADGAFTLTQSTIASNHVRAAEGGANVVILGSGAALEHVTIAGNRAAADDLVVLALRGSADLRGVVLADNRFAGSAAGAPAACVGDGAITGDGNVVPDASCVGAATGVLVTRDAGLGPLVDAGGPTPVLLPGPESPARGARAAGCPPADQRGAPRPPGGPCAAGAAEPDAPEPPTDLLWPLPAEPPHADGQPGAPAPAEGVPGPVAALLPDDGTGLVAARGEAVLVWAPGMPGTAEPAGSVALGAKVTALAREGGLVWAITAAGDLAALDVGDPARPRIVRAVRRSGPRDLFDVNYVQLLPVAPGVLWRVGWRGVGMRGAPFAFVDVWDVSDPAAPRRAGMLDAGVGASPMAWHGGPLAVHAGAAAGSMGSSTRRLKVFDAGDPRQPRALGWVALDGWPVSAALRGTVAWVVERPLVAGEANVVRAFDVADPAGPRLLGTWSEPWDEVVVAAGPFLFLRRGTLLALADASDPLAPRVLGQGDVDGLAGVDASASSVVARLADGAAAVVRIAQEGGVVLGTRVPGGAVVGEVKAAGERVLWPPVALLGQGALAAWRVAPADRPGRVQRVLAPGARAAAYGGGVAWLAAAEAVYPVDIATGAPAGSPISVAGVFDLAVDGLRLWLLRAEGKVVEDWDVSDRAAPALRGTFALTEPARLASGAASGGRLLVVDRLGLRLLDPAAAVPLPVEPWLDAPVVSHVAWDGRTIALVRGGLLARFTVRPDDTLVPSGDVDLGGPIEALTLVHGRAYALGGGALDVVDVAGEAPRWLARVAAPPGAVDLALAGDRLLAALGSGGLAAWRLPAPDRPIVLERCGTTLQGARTVDVSAAGATTITLRVDGVQVGETAPSGTVEPATGAPIAPFGQPDAPIARFDVVLAPGAHVLEAVARAAGQPERTSASVRLTVDPTLPFDPLGTTFDDGAGRGPIGVVGQGGCADAEDGWSVRIDSRQAIDVRVPVRADLAAQSTVRATIGERTTVLAPESEGERGVVVFAGTVPAADPRTTFEGAVVRIAIDGPEPATWQGGAVAPRVWLPWAGR